MGLSKKKASRRVRTEKKEHKPTSMLFDCDGKAVVIPFTALTFEAQEHPCEMCGSHASIKVSFVCPRCTQHHTVELYSH